MNLDQEEREFLSEESSFDIRSVIPKIIQVWPIILISSLVFLIGSYILTRMSVPQFKVSGLFYIKESNSGLSLFNSVPTLGGSARSGLINEMIILKSLPIAAATVYQLDFSVEYYKKGFFINDELYNNTPIIVEVNWKEPQVINGLLTISCDNSEKFTISFNNKDYTKYLPDGTKTKLSNLPEPAQYPFGEWITTNNFTLKVTKTTVDDGGELLIKLRDAGSLTNEYASKLEIENLQKEGSILEISLESPNVKKGEVYINKLMETYIELEFEEKNQIASNTVRFIDSQVAGVSDSLRQFEDRLQSFRASNKTYNLAIESTSVFGQLTEVDSKLRQEQFKRSYYKSLGNYLIREQYNDLVVPSGLGIEDPILNALISNLMELQVEKSRLLATLTEEAPQIQATNNKARDLNRSIQENLKNLDANSVLFIEDLKKQKAEIEDSFKNLPETEQNLLRIERQFNLN